MVYFTLVETTSCLFKAHDIFSWWIIIYFILLRTFEREIFWKSTKLQQLEANVFVIFSSVWDFSFSLPCYKIYYKVFEKQYLWGEMKN